MHRYQVLIEYVGTNFVGWQIQSNGKSIQKLIQTKLSKILKEKVSLVGSGRTDSGVHAIAQSANFILKSKINNKFLFLNSVNFFLNQKKISILKINEKKKNFHARFSAKKREYMYIIINRIAPLSLESNKAWHIKSNLDFKLMRKAANILKGTKDFSTFRSSSCSAKTPIKTLEEPKIKKTGDKIIIIFRSKSFLQQQVRSMVGCLKFVGEKKWSLKKFKEVLSSKKKTDCAPPAPPCGLYLNSIKY